MNDAVCHDPYQRLLLGLYAIGKLDDGERVALERHLSDCSVCRTDRDQVAPVVPALRLLSDTDIRELIEEFTPAVREPATTLLDPVHHAEMASVDDSSRPSMAGATTAVAAAVRPAARPPRWADESVAGPDRSGPRRRRRQVSVAALVVVMVAGVATAIAVRRPDPVPPASVSAVASGDNATGIAISVTVAGQSAQATLTGLHDGVRYELHVVTADGQTFRLAELTGGAGVQHAASDLPVPMGDIVSFSLRQVDGAVVVVTAAVSQPNPTYTPS